MGYRPHIKVRLGDTALAHHAEEVITFWRSVRQLSLHFPRAIAMYAGLQRGDTSLLEEFFPFLSTALGNARTDAPPRRPDSRPVIQVVEKAQEEDVSDLLDSLGI